MPHADLSICILTHSQPVLLPQCVTACFSEIERAQVSAEIIIIDNASADRYPERLAAASPIIRILRNEQNLGFGEANNRAIRTSSGGLLLLLNDDAILQKGVLDLMIRTLESDPRIAVVGPVLYYPDGSVQDGFMNKRFPHLLGMVSELLLLSPRFAKRRWTRHWLTTWGDPERRAEPDQIAGACLLVRRQALDEVGLFDEGFHYIFEDADLCYRIKKAGWRIVCALDGRVTHFGRATYDHWSTFDQTANYFRSINYFLKKHSSPVTYFLARLTLGCAFLLSILKRFLARTVRRQWELRSLSYSEMKNRARFNFGLLRCLVLGK
jgi:GT2 family glycosyltransferase